MVVQPLLPSFFEPVPPLVSDTTLWFSDDQAGVPPGTSFFEGATRSPLNGETTAAQADLAESGQSPNLRSPAHSPSTRILPDATSAWSLHSLLPVSPSVQSQAEPTQQAESLPHEGTSEVSSIPQPLSTPEQNLEKEAEETSRSSFAPSQHARIVSKTEISQQSLEEIQQISLQRDEVDRQNNQTPLSQDPSLERDTHPALLLENPETSLSQFLWQVPVRQLPLQEQGRGQKVNSTDIKHEEANEQEQSENFADQKALLRGLRVSTSSQFLSSSASDVFPQIVSPSGTTAPSIEEAPLPFTQRAKPRIAIQSASSTLQESAKATQARETPEEHTFKSKQKPIIPKNVQHPMQPVSRQETTINEEERESQPIRVHIGRVVVRGVVDSPNSSTTAPAKQMQHPALSLNEYLKRREKGSR